MDDHRKLREFYNYDWAVKLNRAILQIFGLWPHSRNLFWRQMAADFQIMIFTGSVLFFIIIPQTLALIKVWGNLYLMADNLLAMILYLITVIKLAVLRHQKDAVAIIMATIKKDWLRPKTDEETLVMVKYWSLLHVIVLGGVISTALSGITYHVPLAFGIIVRTVTNITDVPGRLLPFSTSYPFDVLPTPRYQIIIFTQVASGFIGGFGFTVSDTLFGMSVLHACSQLQNLSSRMTNMFTGEYGTVRDILKANVDHHVDIIRFITTINDLFSTLLLIFFLTFSIIFCMQGFVLICIISSNQGAVYVMQKSAFFIVYSIYLTFHLFMYCWAGQILVTQSEEIRNSAYRCSWNTLTPKDMLQMNFILMRTQYPLTIYAGRVIPVTLNTFTHLLKTSGGYISVLLASQE